MKKFYIAQNISLQIRWVGRDHLETQTYYEGSIKMDVNMGYDVAICSSDTG